VPEATSAEPTPRKRDRVADAVRPFASRPYRLMWMGSTTSSLGDALVQIALVFAILHIGGTASDIGVVAAVETVAQIAFLLAGGVWADRLRRQYVMLTADAVRGVVQATLAVLLLTGHAHVWELGVGAALYGSASSFFGPASTALVPETVPTEQLQQANSLLGLPQSFFSVGGPAAGGILIAVFGPGWLFAADAASFFVSLACLALLRVPPRPLPAPASFLADLAEGWHELAIRPWYWINLLAHACGNFALPAFFVLGPVIAVRSLGGAAAWGVISGSFGVGAIAAGFVVLRYKPRRPLVTADLLATGLALPLIALGLSHSVAVIAAANAWFGFELIISNTLWYTTMQSLVPDQVRARVDSYDWLVSMVIMPVGYVVAGPLSSSIGFTTTLVAAGLISAIPCSLVVLLPGIRGVRRNTAGVIVGPAEEESLGRNERIRERADAGQPSRQLRAQPVPRGQRLGRGVGHLRLPAVIPDQHLERQVERGQRRGVHHRRARGRAAEQHKHRRAQLQPRLAGLGRLVDHREQRHPLGRDQLGQPRHGGGNRLGAELGDGRCLRLRAASGHHVLLTYAPFPLSRMTYLPEHQSTDHDRHRVNARNNRPCALRALLAVIWDAAQR
jgi:MFS family permease